eukprot:2462854-Pleurochrysis_carterae.AAC.3
MRAYAYARAHTRARTRKRSHAHAHAHARTRTRLHAASVVPQAIGLEHAAAFPSNEGEERQTASLRKKRVRVDAGTGGQAGDADADTDESEDDDDDDDNGDEWFAGTYDDANGYGSADLSVLLQQRHTALSAAFRKAGLNRKQEATDDGDVDSAKTDSTESDAGASGYAGSSTESPLLITFEDMVRAFAVGSQIRARTCI